MFINRLINQTNAPLLERVVEFTQTRHRLIADNIVNASTPGYRQKDLSVDSFNESLRKRLAVRREAPPGSVGFGDIESDVDHPRGGILFHDGNNRSMEQLMSEMSKNALTHNMAIELLRRQFSSMENALKERVS